MDSQSIHKFIDETISEQRKQLLYLWKHKRTLLLQFLNLAMVVSVALMGWKSLMILTNSESPVVVVLSGSMEPAFFRGDILWLDNSYSTPIRVGEIVVFKIKDKEVPIVHRVIEVHETYDCKNSSQADQEVLKPIKGRFLTKGDNNRVNDRGLYAPGQMWLERSDIMGRAKGIVRYMGMVTIILNDFPAVKYLLIGLMGYFVLTNKE